MTLILGPGKDRLEYHYKLHRYAGVVQTFDAFDLVLGDVQDQGRTGKEGVHMDWALALFDGLKLAKDIRVLPQA